MPVVVFQVQDYSKTDIFIGSYVPQTFSRNWIGNIGCGGSSSENTKLGRFLAYELTDSKEICC